jgi:hypothetical protein
VSRRLRSSVSISQRPSCRPRTSVCFPSPRSLFPSPSLFPARICPVSAQPLAAGPGGNPTDAIAAFCILFVIDCYPGECRSTAGQRKSCAATTTTTLAPPTPSSRGRRQFDALLQTEAEQLAGLCDGLQDVKTRFSLATRAGRRRPVQVQVDRMGARRDSRTGGLEAAG